MSFGGRCSSSREADRHAKCKAARRVKSSMEGARRREGRMVKQKNNSSRKTRGRVKGTERQGRFNSTWKVLLGLEDVTYDEKRNAVRIAHPGSNCGNRFIKQRSYKLRSTDAVLAFSRGTDSGNRGQVPRNA